ncbi:MAG: hypothetical protein ACD_7C00301G0008 [uncultured bacterium]|nr:MAG: hypothetical protein ACD_7C00301G0008 [uncultured bacterium]
MLSIEKCRQIDPNLKNLSDKEVFEVRKNLYGMAQLALEDWDNKNNVSKNPEWLLPNKNERVK